MMSDFHQVTHLADSEHATPPQTMSKRSAGRAISNNRLPQAAGVMVSGGTRPSDPGN